MTLSIQDYAALAGIVIAIVGPVLGYLIRIRKNDLFHIDGKLDTMQETMDRVESRIDEHIHDHATGVFK